MTEHSEQEHEKAECVCETCKEKRAFKELVKKHERFAKVYII